jgi:hypothetical protein
MKGSKRLLLLLLPALLVGAIVYVLYNQSTGTTEVVVAKETINAGMKVTGDMLTTTQVPNTAIPKDVFTDTDNIIGKSVIFTRAPGDFIFRNILSDKEPTLEEGEAFVAVELPNALADMVGEGTLLTVVEHLSDTGNIMSPESTAVELEEDENSEDKTSEPPVAPNTPQVIENLPVYTVVEFDDATGNFFKYAIVKTKKETATRLVNLTAKDHSVIITK